MCGDCGAEYGHHSWCREGQLEAVRYKEKKLSEAAVKEAKKMVRIEILAEISGWLKAKISSDVAKSGAYEDVLRYLNGLKTD